jgi:hypothetical protein
MAGVSPTTTLVARRTDTGEVLNVADDLALLRALSDQRALVCPHCGSPLVLKAGHVRLHHFAHQSLAECTYLDREPETESHRLGKFLLYQQFKTGAQEAALERHLPQTDQRADCYIRATNGRAYALEFQQANNSVDRWNERHALYRSQAIADLWFLGSVRYQESASQPAHAVSPYDPLPIPRDRFNASAGVFRVREMERAILAHEARLIYLDPDTRLLTILIPRGPVGAASISIRAYAFRVPLEETALQDGRLASPLDPLLAEYYDLKRTRNQNPK